MSLSPPSHTLISACRPTSHQDWSPPASLLYATAGDDSLMADLILTFNTDLDARIEQIRKALPAADFPKVGAQTHAIRGSAVQMGAGALAQACRELETAAHLRDLALVAAWLNHVQELFEETCRAMAPYSSPGCMPLGIPPE